MASFVYVQDFANKNSAIWMRKTSHRTIEGWMRATGAKEHKITRGPITTYCYRLRSKRLVEVAVLDPETVRSRIAFERALNDAGAYAVDPRIPGPWRAKALHDALVRRGIEIAPAAKAPRRGAGKGGRKAGPGAARR